MDEKAVQTPFSDSGVVHISFPADKCPSRCGTLEWHLDGSCMTIFPTEHLVSCHLLILSVTGDEDLLGGVHRVVFVLKETSPENWLNSGAGDFVAQLKPPDLSDIVDKVVDMEANASHWSLFNRFCMANDVLDAADAAGACVTRSCSLSHRLDGEWQ